MCQKLSNRTRHAYTRKVSASRWIASNSKWYYDRKKWEIFCKNFVSKIIIFFTNLKVETTIRHSEEEKKRALESAKQLHSEYKPLKDHLSSLRESIGLEESNNDNENDEHMLIESFLRFEVYFIL